ncbi:MAG TPA: GNAT family N-acetyltransferase [Streptosporangiaceae bacterium]
METPAGLMRVTSPAPPERWQAAYAADCEAIPYQSPQLTQALCADGLYSDASRCYETDDGRTLVLPLVRRRGLPGRLATAGSLPIVMGGLVADGPVSVEDIRAVLGDLATLPFAALRIRPNPRVGALWSEAALSATLRIPRRAHVVPVSRPVEEIRSGLSNSIRKAVDRAVRNGLEVVWDTTGSKLGVFEELYNRSVERWARRQHEPLSLSRWRMERATRAPTLAATARCMAGVWRMGVVEIGGRPAVAAIIFIEPGGNANGFRMAMDADLVGRTGAGYLVQFAALEEASRAGCRFFHLGESGQAEGLSDHKERMGGIPIAYEELVFERLPVARADRLLRSVVKRAIGFRDANEAAMAR